MEWFDLVKSSPCLREAKQLFYEVMEKLGANDELLREIKNSPSDELIGMIEDLQMEMSGKDEEKIFEKIIINYERCEQESLINPIPQASMGQNFESNFQDKLASEDIRKSKKIVLPLFKEAINEVTSGENLVTNNLELHNKIKDIYKNKLIENDYGTSFIAMHMRYKLVPSKMKPVVGRALTSLGWKSSQSMGTRVWRR
tara:strand:- start:3599 stop:4195 length:597 start_codon:yes stop_codon:yes gene_type:complete